jgi:hypothetical protein
MEDFKDDGVLCSTGRSERSRGHGGYSFPLFWIKMSLYKDIYTKYELGPIQHMTSINNLSSILQIEAIVSKNNIIKSNISINDISNQSVQSGRSTKNILGTSYNLHDFVPLYWARKTPMGFVLKEKNEEIIFVRFSTEILAKFDCYISDGNAFASGTKLKKYNQISDLDLLSPGRINARYFAGSEEDKRIKQSEVLVFDKLPVDELLDIECINATVRAKVLDILAKYGSTYKVLVNQNFYFVN